MKQRICFVILIVFVLVLLTTGLILGRTNKNISALSVIAEKSYENYAWGRTYRGEAILSDGTIVEWENYDSYYSLKDIVDNSNWIIKNCKVKIRRVSKKDLKKLNEYIGHIQDEFKYESSKGFDIGSTCIKIYNYEIKRQLKLTETGDLVGNNNSEIAIKCVKLIEKYL